MPDDVEPGSPQPFGIYGYRELDASGDLERAVRRMEDRAREPASAELFDRLVKPLLEGAGVSAAPSILEVGCGTGALTRRVALGDPTARVFATDKSSGMIAAARALARAEEASNLTLEVWDVTRDTSFPFSKQGSFDLILSSVMVPYLGPAEVEAAVRALVKRLRSGGVLAFIEQDLSTDSLFHPDRELVARVFAKDGRVVVRHAGLGMRELLRDAGLEILERESFLWTEQTYGRYLQDLLPHIVADALAVGRIDQSEHDEFLSGLRRLRKSGDFYYGLVYHRIAGRRSDGQPRRPTGFLAGTD